MTDEMVEEERVESPEVEACKWMKEGVRHDFNKRAIYAVLSS